MNDTNITGSRNQTPAAIYGLGMFEAVTAAIALVYNITKNQRLSLDWCARNIMGHRQRRYTKQRTNHLATIIFALVPFIYIGLPHHKMSKTW